MLNTSTFGTPMPSGGVHPIINARAMSAFGVIADVAWHRGMSANEFLRNQDPTRTFSLATAQCQDRVVARTSLNCVTHLNRRLLRESWLIAVQPISFMSRSNSVRIIPSARSTPAWPAAAKGQR